MRRVHELLCSLSLFAATEFLNWFLEFSTHEGIVGVFLKELFFFLFRFSLHDLVWQFFTFADFQFAWDTVSNLNFFFWNMTTCHFPFHNKLFSDNDGRLTRFDWSIGTRFSKHFNFASYLRNIRCLHNEQIVMSWSLRKRGRIYLRFAN